MAKQRGLSWLTRRNFAIDATLAVGGILAALSGIYFLFLPSGGSRGGSNPFYGVTILFERNKWEDAHTWGGIAMIVAAAVHLILHWAWVKMMARRVGKAIVSREAHLSKGARVNVALDAVVAVSFVLTAVTGLYFLFGPSGGYEGGRNLAWDPGFLFSRTTWDLIHIWAGNVLIAAAVAHLYIHWRWVKNVTVKLACSLRPAAGPSGLARQQPVQSS